jgi:hypothetical protein
VAGRDAGAAGFDAGRGCGLSAATHAANKGISQSVAIKLRMIFRLI